MIPAIFGTAGTALTPEERDFFRDADPAGYILFGRNCETREQVRALTDSLRELHGRDDLAILIDQEGGRVSRMKPPEWTAFPPGEVFDALYDISPISAIEAARANARALGMDLAEAGVTVDCLPLLDIRQPYTDNVIGDRALGSEPQRVAALGRAVIEGLADAGVVSVVKHMPGHGRALCDSHRELPVVSATAEELELDMAPFAALKSAPMAMTAHIVYTAWDADHCATMSPTVIDGIIRRRIGFDGWLMSDDIDMEALDGPIPARARTCVDAGCDVALNCWARMDDMVGIARALDEITAESRGRLERAMAGISPRTSIDREEQRAHMARRDALLAVAASA